MRMSHVLLLAALFSCCLAIRINANDITAHRDSRSNTTSRVFDTIVTVQVVTNPILRRNLPVSRVAFKALADSKLEMVRYAAWFPYPVLGVAELYPPTKTDTYWDFTLIDPMVEDFMTAMEGRPPLINFCTIPQWMWVTPSPVEVPQDPYSSTWGYSPGTQLRDPSGKEVAEYYARLLSWYTKGGFTDELGVFHKSGYNYNWPYWEVGNEVANEHGQTPEFYTKLYDVITVRLLQVQPNLKFVGLALGDASAYQYYNYFLNASNHAKGAPIDWISFHFYAGPPNATDLAFTTMFPAADRFITIVKNITAIRDRLNPKVKFDVNELGVIMAGYNNRPVVPPFPKAYWNACGAYFVYTASLLALEGVAVVGQSQLAGYPLQYASVSLVNFTTGAPTAKLRAQNLMNQYVRRGDRIQQVSSSKSELFVLSVIDGKDQSKRLLIINKSQNDVALDVENTNGGMIEVVDQTTGEGAPSRSKFNDFVVLGGFAVAVVTFT